MSNDSKKPSFRHIQLPSTSTQSNLADNSSLNKGRLTSLKAPRDLSLGGGSVELKIQRGSSKKVYVPNLSVARRKNALPETSGEFNKANRYGKNKTERGGRGRGGKNSRIIQSTGLFSEGIAAPIIPKLSGVSYRTSNSNNDLIKPTITKEVIKVDKEAESLNEREILEESDEDDYTDNDIDEQFLPVQLTEVKWDEVDIKNEISDIKDMIIKKEIKSETDNDDNDPNDQVCYTKFKVNYDSKQLHTHPLDNLISSTSKQLFLLQFPDTLPCDEHTKTEEKFNADNEANLNTKNTNEDIYLKDLEEKRLGKLIKYKSGKYKLILGDIKYDLEKGIETGFLQHLVSVKVNREERSGDMIDLGEIHSKINVIPDWEMLLKDNL